MIWSGRAIVDGTAEGPALISWSPLSFLGDIDIRTGAVVEPGSDIQGQSIAGTVLVIPKSRGSAGAWRFLYQLHQHDTYPLALITDEVPDPSVVPGAIMCHIPVISGIARSLADSGASAGDILAVDGPDVRARA